MASRGNSWDDPETRCLLGIWKEHNIQQQLDGTVRNSAIMRRIVEIMAANGYNRTPTQVKNKMKKLRESYRQTEDNNRASGRGRMTCKYYEELQQIIGGRPETAPVAVIASVELDVQQASTDSADVSETNDIPEEVYDPGTDTDSSSDVEKDVTPDVTPKTPPELVGAFIPEAVAGQGTPRTAKSKGTKRKKSKLQQSLEWMGKQMRVMDQESTRQHRINEDQHRQEHLQWERELLQKREELEEKRRREDREFQERERERDRQHQLQMLQIAASAFQNPMLRNSSMHNTEAMPAQLDSYSSWDQACSGPRYTSL